MQSKYTARTQQLHSSRAWRSAGPKWRRSPPTPPSPPPQAGGAARVARRACRPPRGPCGLRGGSLGQHVVPRPACHELARLEDGRLASEARRGISPGASQRRDAPWSGRACRSATRVCCAPGWVSRARGGGGPSWACGARAGYERLAARQQSVSRCVSASRVVWCAWETQPATEVFLRARCPGGGSARPIAACSCSESENERSERRKVAHFALESPR